MLRLVQDPGFRRWLDQMHAIGGCAHPIYLSGHTTTREAATGDVLRVYSTADEPHGVLAVRCGNRRESRCEPCSRLHGGDTYHLVRAGLTGGKTVPAAVADHPRLFVTLTAPGFGPVHRATSDERCRPRRSGGQCIHGSDLGCGAIHGESDSAVGQPLCPACYDYSAHVLWHAKAGELWNRTCILVRRNLAATLSIKQRDLNNHLRVSFAKVAEYQKRGAVHVHAVIRVDGPDGPSTPPPSRVSSRMLSDVVESAVEDVETRTPYAPALGEYIIKWGDQFDVHPISPESAHATVTDSAVAAYVAKYVSKSVGDVGGVDRPIESASEIGRLPVTPHVRALMGACWRLGGIAALESLRLRLWAHALGYRGHVLTKSRKYSTTYAALQAVRSAFRSGGEDEEGVSVESVWRYVSSGHSLAEAEIASGIAADIAVSRGIAKEESGRVSRGGGVG
ncbi:replication initiator [Streptomyces sp. NEAU-S77]|uniref:replication initiator n=1 Tax=Streptomyces sp. NEAU-S77 TaxID=3411033 RepID=UPI003BA0FE25